MPKPAQERFCSNCRAELPPKATECPACGVYAGDLYDERVHRPRTRVALFGALLVLAVVAGGAAVWWNARGALPERTKRVSEAPSARVVRDRPGGARKRAGAKINEAEAIRLVRRHLVAATGTRTDCIALMGGAFRNRAYVVTAYDSCSSTRLGKWRVDGRTGEVARALH